MHFLNRKWSTALSALVVGTLLCATVVGALAQEQSDGDNAGNIVFLPLVTSNSQNNAEIDTPQPFAGKTNQLIVRYQPNTQAAAADHTTQTAELSEAADLGLSFVREMSGDAIVVSLPRWMDQAEASAVANRLLTLADVDYAEPDRILQTQITPDDTQYGSQWHYFAPTSGSYGANLPGAWNISTGSASVVVAVIDTGILPHADLAGRTVPGYDFISDAQVANDGGGRDNNPADPGDWVTTAENASGYFAGCGVRNSSWHGTHVAGTIGANSNNSLGVTGINWSAKILPLRVLGKCGGYTSDIADAIRWAAGLSVSGVPANANPAKVINLSLGGSGACDATSQSAITAAVNAGTVVAVAAGNSNANAANYSPASCTGVVTVASTGPTGRRAYYSNYGASVEIAAPGGDSQLGNTVLSTLNTGTTAPVADSYAFYQGTSMATPHVAGIVSLMFSVNPNLTPAQVTSLLQSNITAFPSDSSCTTAICGPGIINAAAVVSATQSAASQPPAAFAKSSPANAGSVAGTSTTLSWGASIGASSYEYCMDTSNDNSCATWTSSGTATSATVTGLVVGTTYYWQARALNSVGTTEANANTWWSFGVTPVPAPGAFNKSSPANSATRISRNPTLRWNASSGATRYEVCWDTINNNSCDGTWSNVGTSRQVSANELSPATTYYWQVRAVNDGGTTNANADTWWSFGVKPVPAPGAFNKSSPASGATRISRNPIFRWNASGGATRYEVCWDTINNNSCDGSWSNVDTVRQVSANGLGTSTTYYWQVRAVNVGGTTDANAGLWWSFGVEPVAAPVAFNKSSPVNGATRISRSPTLRWAASSGATRYEVCWDTTNNNSCDGTWSNVGASRQVSASGLSAMTTYYWQVRAVNVDGTTNANADTGWSFTTG